MWDAEIPNDAARFTLVAEDSAENLPPKAQFPSQRPPINAPLPWNHTENLRHIVTTILGRGGEHSAAAVHGRRA